MGQAGRESTEACQAVEAVEAEVKSRLIESIRELKLNEFIAGWSKVAS